MAYITDENLKKALARKDRLLDFDRNSAKRTEVVDDETDYYKLNSALEFCSEHFISEGLTKKKSENIDSDRE